jgi:hypothetical protein
MSHDLINSITSAPAHMEAINVTERYAYRQGSRYVNKYPRLDSSGNPHEGDTGHPNHLLGCYPTLFPYGKGGFEVLRPIKVAYERHI